MMTIPIQRIDLGLPQLDILCQELLTDPDGPFWVHDGRGGDFWKKCCCAVEAWADKLQKDEGGYVDWKKFGTHTPGPWDTKTR